MQTLSNTTTPVQSISEELSGAEFGDKRLNKRLGKIVDAITLKADESFPEAMGSDGELEGFYRFLRNEKVNPEKILEPHYQATKARIIAEKEVLVISDTTKFKFSGPVRRKDLGWIATTHKKETGVQGFFGHFALAVSMKEALEPLGIIGLTQINRTHKPIGSVRTFAQQSVSDKETNRWGELVSQVEERLGGEANVIHVMDREGDMYRLLSSLISNNRRFVIRVRHNRSIVVPKNEVPTLFPYVAKAEAICEREVFISSRKKKYFDLLPRPSRMAKLAFSATEVSIKKVKYDPGPENLKSVRVNVVRVWEIDPPEGEEPIEWRLETTEPISTQEEILKIVDIYRARWIIEEYFKALKTGCGYEKRQMESYSTLQNALALLIPVAWKILTLRYLSRSQSKTPADKLLTPTMIEVLRYAYRKPLPKRMTIRDATLAIASLGGHHKSNGDPGWQILWRGYRHLLLLEFAWIGGKRCDR